jgi:hypothetical protein
MSTLAAATRSTPGRLKKPLSPSSPLTKNAAPTPANTASDTGIVEKSPFMDGH